MNKKQQLLLLLLSSLIQDYDKMTPDELQWFVNKFKLPSYGMELPDEDDEYVRIKFLLKAYNFYYFTYIKLDAFVVCVNSTNLCHSLHATWLRPYYHTMLIQVHWT